MKSSHYNKQIATRHTPSVFSFVEATFPSPGEGAKNYVLRMFNAGIVLPALGGG